MKPNELTPFQECLRDILLVAIGDRFRDDDERKKMAELMVDTYGSALIDHTCDWLSANACKYITHFVYRGVKMTGIHVSLEEDFKKAMIKKGGENE